MALNAIGLKNVGVALDDANGLVEVLQRERLAVSIPVVRLGDVLFQKRMRQMAVDAGGGLVMPGLGPRVVLIVHDVAVGAGLRGSGEITGPFGVVKRERSSAREASAQRHENEDRPSQEQGSP